jgi:hypothetical protein
VSAGAYLGCYPVAMAHDEVEPSTWARYASNIAAGLVFGLATTLACLALVDTFGYQHFLASLANL